MARCCDADAELLRSAQCDDAEIQAHLLMHARGKCPDNDEHLAEYQRDVEMIRGYGFLPRGHHGPHYG